MKDQPKGFWDDDAVDVAAPAASFWDDDAQDVLRHPNPRLEPGIPEALMRGGVQGVTMGHGDELAGAGQALWDIATTDKELGDLGDVYRQHRDESRANFKAAADAHPIANGIGTLAGGLATTLAVPGAGLGALGRVGLAAAGGGIAGEGNSEADLTQGDLAGVAKDAAKGAVISGALQGVGDKVVGALAPTATRATAAVANKVRGAADALEGMAAKVRPTPRLREDLSNWGALEQKAETSAGGLMSEAKDWAMGQLTPGKVIRAAKTGGVSLAKDAAMDATKRFGRPLAGKALDRLSDVVRSAPETLGKWAAPLQAAAARGPHALAVTNYILQQTEDGYRQQVGVDGDEEP